MARANRNSDGYPVLSERQGVDARADSGDSGTHVHSYLTTPEAATYLNVSTQFLEIARHRGVGPPYCKIGRAVRYRRASLDQWMISNEKRAN
ncbi:MAG: helix-turn-helix domain-containing protein [Rhizomicrobium sp.]